MTSSELKSLEKRVVGLRYFLLGAQYFEALKAMELSLTLFEGKKRKDGTPVTDHFISVAEYTRTLSSSLIFPDRAITTGLLHDVIEDTKLTYNDLLQEGFSQEVVQDVMLLTKNTSDDKTVVKSPSLYFSSIAASPVASICKGADRIHNFKTMIGVFTPAKQLEYVQEAREHIVPMIKLARRKFPQQEPAYENIKTFLLVQMQMAEHKLKESSHVG